MVFCSQGCRGLFVYTGVWMRRRKGLQSRIGEMNLQKAVYGISVVVLFSVTTAVMWKQGLKHYNSANL